MSDTLVLCYHALTEAWVDLAAVQVSRFQRQLSLLSALGYKGVTFTDAVAGEARGKRVAITFDDAFHSVLDAAFPLLNQLGWPGTVFVVTDYADGNRPLAWPPRFDRWVGTPQEHELKPLGWRELHSLVAAGWEVGSHTCSHPHLTDLSAAQARRELAGSRATCEAQLEKPCLSIAYPYGDCNQSIVNLAGDVGYRTGAALPRRLHRCGPLEWPRVGVYNTDRLLRFALKALPARRRLHDARRSFLRS